VARSSSTVQTNAAIAAAALPSAISSAVGAPVPRLVEVVSEVASGACVRRYAAATNDPADMKVHQSASRSGAIVAMIE